jgi:hypothetical protein
MWRDGPSRSPGSENPELDPRCDENATAGPYNRATDDQGRLGDTHRVVAHIKCAVQFDLSRHAVPIVCLNDLLDYLTDIGLFHPSEVIRAETGQQQYTSHRLAIGIDKVAPKGPLHLLTRVRAFRKP